MGGSGGLAERPEIVNSRRDHVGDEPVLERAGFFSQGKSSVSRVFVSSSRSNCCMRRLESSKLSQHRMWASSGTAALLRIGKKKVPVFDFVSLVSVAATRSRWVMFRLSPWLLFSRSGGEHPHVLHNYGGSCSSTHQHKQSSPPP